MVRSLLHDLGALCRLGRDPEHHVDELVETLLRLGLGRLDHQRLGNDERKVDRRRVDVEVHQPLGDVERGDHGQPTPPACWRNPSGQIGGGGTSASASPGTVDNPGTAASPRVIKLDETSSLQITDAAGKQLTVIPVKAGETVTFQVTNTAGFDHNFYIGPQDALQAGNTTGLQGIPTFSTGTKELTWTVPQSGAGLQFACVVPGHYTTMHGEFNVIP